MELNFEGETNQEKLCGSHKIISVAITKETGMK